MSHLLLRLRLFVFGPTTIPWDKVFTIEMPNQNLAMQRAVIEPHFRNVRY